MSTRENNYPMKLNVPNSTLSTQEISLDSLLLRLQALEAENKQLLEEKALLQNQFNHSQEVVIKSLTDKNAALECTIGYLKKEVKVLKDQITSQNHRMIIFQAIMVYRRRVILFVKGNKKHGFKPRNFSQLFSLITNDAELTRFNKMLKILHKLYPDVPSNLRNEKELAKYLDDVILYFQELRSPVAHPISESKGTETSLEDLAKWIDEELTEDDRPYAHWLCNALFELCSIIGVKSGKELSTT